mgnify:CR=1 FL=1
MAQTFPIPSKLARILAPQLDHQVKWARLLTPGAAIVGYQVRPGFFKVCAVSSLTVGSDLRDYGDGVREAFASLIHGAPRGTILEVPDSEFHVVGFATEHAASLGDSDVLKLWCQLAPAELLAA